MNTHADEVNSEREALSRVLTANFFYADEDPSVQELADAVLAAGFRRSEVPEPSGDDGLAEEMRCQGCGARNPVWWAANGAWNLAVGGDASREAGGMLCPTCFHQRWLAATGSEPQGEPRAAQEAR